jgi:hypothetical protein
MKSIDMSAVASTTAQPQEADEMCRAAYHVAKYGKSAAKEVDDYCNRLRAEREKWAEAYSDLLRACQESSDWPEIKATFIRFRRLRAGDPGWYKE